MQIELAMDRPGLFKVGHDANQVVPLIGSLEIIDMRNSRATLIQAADLATRAMRSLPETPLTGVGVNIRYTDPAVPNELIDLLAAEVDTVLADNNHTLVQASTVRTIEMAPGVINLNLRTSPDGSGSVEFNFHRDSGSVDELSAWLARTGEFHDVAVQMVGILGVTL